MTFSPPDKGELSIPIGMMRQRRPDSTPVCYLVSSLNESKSKQLCRRNPIGVIKYPFLARIEKFVRVCQLIWFTVIIRSCVVLICISLTLCHSYREADHEDVSIRDENRFLKLQPGHLLGLWTSDGCPELSDWRYVFRLGRQVVNFLLWTSGGQYMLWTSVIALL
jgi:hypothetical protein